MADWKDSEMQGRNGAGGWSANEGQSFHAKDRKRKNVFRKSRRGYNERESRKAFEDSTKEKTSFKVPASKVGRVIGRQGAKIRELQNATRTYIQVSRENYDGQVEICISGSLESQEKCKDMILRLTDEQVFDSPGRQEEEIETGREEAAAAGGDEAAAGYEDLVTKKDGDDFCYIDWDAVKKRAEEWEKKRWAHLPPMKKDFYIEDPAVALMSEEYVRELRKSLNDISASHPFGGTGKIPNPVETFDQAFAPYPELLKELNRQRFTKPFPIQSQGWPILLSGKDMIGIAQTGTGKTLAFLLPAFIHTYGQEIPFSKRNGPNVLILAPTRELALQIDGEAKKFQYRTLRSVCLYGGGERGEQIRTLGKGVQMVIATPGRLNDCISSGALNLDSVTFLVLDEADRMLDMGFERQIRRILLTLRPDRQTVMTSATWPYVIQRMAQKYMNEPIKVLIGSPDLAAVHSVRQTVYIVQEEKKFDCLMRIISDLTPRDKMIIFVGKRAVADSLACDLILSKIECQSIHGNRVQSDREQAIDELKSGVVRILVATDVASRGLDIVDVTKVVNYDFPRNIEEYVHRVGRTGRAGKTGEAISFFTQYDRAHAKDLISILEEAKQVVPRELRRMGETYDPHQDKSRHYFGRGRNYGSRR